MTQTRTWSFPRAQVTQIYHPIWLTSRSSRSQGCIRRPISRLPWNSRTSRAWLMGSLPLQEMANSNRWTWQSTRWLLFRNLTIRCSTVQYHASREMKAMMWMEVRWEGPSAGRCQARLSWKSAMWGTSLMMQTRSSTLWRQSTMVCRSSTCWWSLPGRSKPKERRSSQTPRRSFKVTSSQLSLQISFL